MTNTAVGIVAGVLVGACAGACGIAYAVSTWQTYTVVPAQQTGDYVVGDILGKGAFGVVHKVKRKSCGNYYAMKIVETVEGGKQELSVLTKLPRHDHIVQIFDTSHEKGKFTYLFMELYPEGDLNKFLLAKDKKRQQNNYNNNLRDLKFVKQMASAVQFLHKHGVIHRDLKLENVLVHKADEYHVKISDFGLSKIVVFEVPLVSADLVKSGQLEKMYMKTGVGTVIFMAPEIISREGTKYNSKVDIFALGVIYCAMLERKTYLISGREYICALCPGNVPIGYALNYSPGAVRELADNVWINGVANVNTLLRPLVNAMMKTDHYDRPSTSDVYRKLHSLCTK